MARTAPGLVVVLVTLLAATPGAVAVTAVGKCKVKQACDAGRNKPPKKPKKPTGATGWHNGVYDGGPGDPIIAPLR